MEKQVFEETEIRFEHLALAVSEVEESLKFYCEILGLKEIQRPNFDFKGAWISMGTGLSIHLIEGKPEVDTKGSRGNHFAFKVKNLEAWVEKMKNEGVQIVKGPKQREDGVWQLFVSDPNGYVIELNE